MIAVMNDITGVHPVEVMRVEHEDYRDILAEVGEAHLKHGDRLLHLVIFKDDGGFIFEGTRQPTVFGRA